MSAEAEDVIMSSSPLAPPPLRPTLTPPTPPPKQPAVVLRAVLKLRSGDFFGELDPDRGISGDAAAAVAAVLRDWFRDGFRDWLRDRFRDVTLLDPDPAPGSTRSPTELPSAASTANGRP